MLWYKYINIYLNINFMYVSSGKILLNLDKI